MLKNKRLNISMIFGKMFWASLWSVLLKCKSVLKRKMTSI